VEPWLQDADVTLYHGDVLTVLRDLPAESVDTCVTSPPYWGLRDYGQEGQLGLEPTPEEYVTRMVEVFREVRRVLAPHGTVWLNLGDSYANNHPNPNNDDARWEKSGLAGIGSKKYRDTLKGGTARTVPKATPGLKNKDLVGIPWRVAFALQADGWYLRSDIIWAKPNPMPESVTDRPTKAHEYVFLLSKQPRYFFDQEAVREPQEASSLKRLATGWNGDKVRGWPRKGQHNNFDRYMGKTAEEIAALPGRNIRSVWEIATQPYAEAHFAVFPEELPRRCILAGCPEQGVVLDPFGGSGTTALVARKHNRRSILIELNESYCELAARRLQQQSLFAESAA
jgi:DNA modification methylase